MQQFIVLADADGIVDMTPMAISARTSIPREIIDKGIDILSAPDKYTRTEGSDGRRIELIDAHRPWGWVLVNYDHYKSLRDSDTVRAQTRERVRKHRAAQNVTHGNAPKRHIDIDIDIKTSAHFDTFWQAYPKKKDKLKARKAWIKNNCDKHATAILQNIELRTDWTDIQFIPYPTTYLHGERWTDELEAVPVHKPRKPKGELTAAEIKARDELLMKEYGK